MCVWCAHHSYELWIVFFDDGGGGGPRNYDDNDDDDIQPSQPTWDDEFFNLKMV